ncbi:MAG: hypothetical protein ABEJ65_06860, partial [bacterium]
MNYSKWISGFLLVLVLLFGVTGQAFATLDAAVDIETEQNQAFAPQHILEVFSGSVSDNDENTGPLEFSFTISDAAALDDIDTARLMNNSSASLSLEDEVSVTSRNFTLTTSSCGSSCAGPNSPFLFSIDIISDKGADHDEDFTFTLDSVKVQNVDNIDNAGWTSDLITVKNLIESYHMVNEGNGDIPAILVSESDTFPIAHIDMAGQNRGGTLGFNRFRPRFRELIGEFIPGGRDSNDNYGDFSTVQLVRSTSEVFGQGQETVICNISRTSLPNNDPNDAMASDTYYADFIGSGSNSLGSGGCGAADENADGTIDSPTIEFTNTTDQSHYFITVATNQGWDTSTETSFAQYSGYGDAWDAWIDTGNIALTNGDTNISPTNATQGAIHHSVDQFASGFLGNANSKHAPKLGHYFGSPVNGLQDQTGLDFSPDVVFWFTAFGASSKGDINTDLNAVTITFPRSSDSFNPREDLRKISNNRKSGIQIWENVQNFNPTVEVNNDKNLPLSPANSTWLSDTKVRIQLQEGYTLPSVSDALSNPDPNLESNVGLLSSSIQPTHWLLFLTDDSALDNDTFVAEIPLGGLHFDQGNSVDDTGPTSTTGELNSPIQTVVAPDSHSVQSGTRPQVLKTKFSDLTNSGQKIGAPSDPSPVFGINAVDDSNKSPRSYRDDAILKEINMHFEEGGSNFTADDLNPLNNTDTSGIAVYMDNDEHPENNNGVFDPEIDRRLQLDLTNSSKSAPGGTDDPFARIELTGIGGETGAVTDSPDTPDVPATDTGDSEGIDFFVVVNTSDQADNSDQFRVTLGDRVIEDGIDPHVEYVEKGNMSNVVDRIFHTEDKSNANRFYTHTITINTLTALSVNDLTNPNESIDVVSPPKGVLAFNGSDGTGGDQTFDKATLTFDFTNSTDTGDIAELTATEQSGASVYKDDGDGVFEANEDEFLPILDPSWEVF